MAHTGGGGMDSVERSHGNLRGTNGSDHDRFQNPGRKLDHSGRYQRNGNSQYKIGGAVD